MVYENEKHIVIYLYDEELTRFKESGCENTIGVAYTWENEDVVHLHLTPVAHSFGKTSKCLFTLSYSQNLSEICNEDNIEWVVSFREGDLQVNHVSLGLLEENVNVVPAKADLYSRSKGILEIGILEKKHVAIIGLGSFGSQIAIELSKAGVGEFSLFDFDRVELHNLARHICTTKDLGRLKTDAIEEAVLGKNPYAIVHKYPIDITKNIELLDSLLPSIDIVLCATDNNKSRIELSELLHKHQKIGIFGRAITRAEGGDVFRYRPGGPCYCCMIGKIGTVDEEITGLESGLNNGQIPQYADNPEAMVQVGLSSDIEPICNMMIKLTLVELSRGKQSGIQSLEDELVYDYYIWVNRRDNKYSNWHAMPKAGAMPTIMRWYGAYILKLDNCTLCSTSSDDIELDEGEDDEKLLQNIAKRE